VGATAYVVQPGSPRSTLRTRNALFYASVEKFVREQLAPMYRRALDGSHRTWCPERWRHAEAISRLEALWRAWEHLRHLALQGEELTALGHLHEDTLHTERAELVRDRAIRAAAASCCLRHRVTLPRVGLTGRAVLPSPARHRPRSGSMATNTNRWIARG
jgi:hypothetical protein